MEPVEDAGLRLIQMKHSILHGLEL
jgi:hypothetical protein